MSESSYNPVQDMATNGRIEILFSTPLFSHVLKNVEALNAELRDLILERERAEADELAPSYVDGPHHRAVVSTASLCGVRRAAALGQAPWRLSDTLGKPLGRRG